MKMMYNTIFFSSFGLTVISPKLNCQFVTVWPILTFLLQYFFSENAATPCGGWLNPNIGQPNCTCLVHNVSTFNIFEVTMRKICPFYLGTLKKILSVTLLYKSAKT